MLICLVFNEISSMLASSLLISIYFTGLNYCDSREMLQSRKPFLFSGLKEMVLSLRLTSNINDLDFLKSSFSCSKPTMFLTN